MYGNVDQRKHGPFDNVMFGFWMIIFCWNEMNDFCGIFKMSYLRNSLCNNWTNDFCSKFQIWKHVSHIVWNRKFMNKFYTIFDILYFPEQISIFHNITITMASLFETLQCTHTSVRRSHTHKVLLSPSGNLTKWKQNLNRWLGEYSYYGA